MAETRWSLALNPRDAQEWPFPPRCRGQRSAAEGLARRRRDCSSVFRHTVASPGINWRVGESCAGSSSKSPDRDGIACRGVRNESSRLQVSSLLQVSELEDGIPDRR